MIMFLHKQFIYFWDKIYLLKAPSKFMYIQGSPWIVCRSEKPGFWHCAVKKWLLIHVEFHDFFHFLLNIWYWYLMIVWIVIEGMQYSKLKIPSKTNTICQKDGKWKKMKKSLVQLAYNPAFGRFQISKMPENTISGYCTWSATTFQRS